KEELKGTIVGDWLVGDYIDSGKSALLLHASKPGHNAAIKIFDQEIIERYGGDSQKKRIEREKELIGKEHPNLIKIFDGGPCSSSGYYFVVMEYLSGKTLSKSLDAIPRSKIGEIIAKLASAAKFLESLGLAHRDIKPDNIMICGNDYNPVLLDLGVLRPTSSSGITDREAKPFIGTLQYSSPEFLLREEKDNPDGWRAVTFYQLGAVLHDMIMQNQIFNTEKDPFARLVQAVLFKQPQVVASDIDQRLVHVAKNCLVKDPEERLKIVDWTDFSDNVPEFTLETIKDTIRKFQLRSRTLNGGSEKSKTIKDEEIKRTLQQIATGIYEIILDTCISDNTTFPPSKTQRISYVDKSLEHIVISFESSDRHGLNGHMSICISVELLDLMDKVVAIGVEIKTGNEEIPIDSFASSSGEIFYKGMVDSYLKEQVKMAIYSKFAEALLKLEQLKL
ncbi:MAG: protein kinase, partial [Candidatus Zambryskibacteria bacterium]|nr:protein kinase [Candidatus Zambryskibacteria bacterium]